MSHQNFNKSSFSIPAHISALRNTVVSSSWAFWWSCGGDSASFCCLLYPVGSQISPLSIFLCQLPLSIWFSSSKNSCVCCHCLFHSICPWRAHLLCCDAVNVETKDISAVVFSCKLLSALPTSFLYLIFLLCFSTLPSPKPSTFFRLST